MAELRLEDVGAILIGLMIVGVAYAGIRTLYEYRASIATLGRAVFARHFNRDWWQDFVIWLADQGASVNDFEDEDDAPRHAAALLSTGVRSADRVGPAVLGSGTAPDTSRYRCLVPARDLTERETIVMLAVQKNGSKWRYSGKKIYNLVGGNHDQFLALMREIRGDLDPETAPPDLAFTPFAGRPTRASYYPDEPELEYQEPQV